MLTSLLAACVLQSPQKDFTGPRKRAAVSGFDVLIKEMKVYAPTPSGAAGEASLDLEEPTEFGQGMVEMLTTALIDSKRFVVLERQNLKDVIEEQKLGEPETPAADGTVQAARVIGAQALIRGAVTELSFRKSQTNLGGGLLDDVVGGSASFVATCGIDLRIVDVATGQVLDSVHAEGKVGNRNRFVGFTKADFAFGHNSFDNSSLAKAVRAAIKNGVEKVCARLERVPWEARVASVAEGGLLYLNFGEDTNLKAGTVLELFRPGKPIVDPQTREVLGREDDLPLGSCTIRTVNKRFAAALVTKGENLQVGDGVRLPPT